MKKKSFLSLLAIVMVVIVSISFVSCGGSDDDENSGNQGNGNEPLTESQKFVGFWDVKDDEKWVFFPNGKCTYIELNGYDVYRTNGSWSYDEKTQTLVTTIESNHFLINYVSDYAWDGIRLNYSSTISCTRDNIGYARESLINKNWKGTNGNIRFSSDSRYSGCRYNGKDNNMVWCLENWNSDNGFPEVKDPSVFYEDGEYYGMDRTYWEVEVERCINASKVSFESNNSMTIDADIDDDYFYRAGWWGYKIHLKKINIFKGTIRVDNMNSSDAKLSIDGKMNGSSFKREYSLN